MQEQRRYIHVVEGARGVAAFYILFHHAILLADSASFFSQNSVLKILYDFSSSFTNHILMMFFLLSGFSIHYANQGRINTLSWLKIRPYLYKRMRRIYPIYVLAVVLSLVAIVLLQNAFGSSEDWAYPSLAQIAGAFFFFSDLPSRDGTWVSTLSTNGPLWSLSYEVLYYLLYPFFSVAICRYGAERAVAAAVFVSLCAFGFAVVVAPVQPSNMVSLYILWCLGAYLAELLRRPGRYSFNPLLLYCIVFAWAQSLWIFESFLLWRIPLAIHLYIGLFIFVVMFAGMARIQSAHWVFKQRLLCLVFAVVVSGAAAAAAITLKTTDNYPYFYVRLLLVFVLGVAWLLSRPDSLIIWIKKVMNLWQSAGAYSYGLYILQFPVLIVIYAVVEVAGGSPLWGLLGVVPVIYFAKMVELRMQPRVASLMDASLLRRPGVIRNSARESGR